MRSPGATHGSRLRPGTGRSTASPSAAVARVLVTLDWLKLANPPWRLMEIGISEPPMRRYAAAPPYSVTLEPAPVGLRTPTVALSVSAERPSAARPATVVPFPPAESGTPTSAATDTRVPPRGLFHTGIPGSRPGARPGTVAPAAVAPALPSAGPSRTYP